MPHEVIGVEVNVGVAIDLKIDVAGGNAHVESFMANRDISKRKFACSVAWKTATKLGVLFRDIAMVD